MLGDGVEDHTLDRLIGQRALLAQHLKNVPGNRLALTIGVGRENQLVGAFDRAGDIVHPLLGAFVDLPDHLEIGVRIDRAVLGRQIANMAKRGQHLIAGAEILIDGLGLGWRFNDNNIHEIPTA